MTIRQRKIFQEHRRYAGMRLAPPRPSKPVYQRLGHRWYFLSDRQVVIVCAVLFVLIVAIGGW